MCYQAKPPLQAKVTVTTVVQKLGTQTWVLCLGLPGACSVIAERLRLSLGPRVVM